MFALADGFGFAELVKQSIRRFVIAGIQQCHCLIQLLLWDDNRRQHNYKCDTGDDNRCNDCNGSLTLLSSLFRSYTSFLSPAFTFETICVFLCFDLFDLSLTDVDLLVGILPPRDRTERFDCRFVPAYSVSSHLRPGVSVDGVLAANLGAFKALLGKGVRVHKIGYCFERFRHRLICCFAVRRIHGFQSAVIDPGQPLVFVPFVDMRDTAVQLVLERFIAEADGFLEVVASVEWLLAIGEILLSADMKFCHQLAQICLSVLRVKIKHLLTKIVGFRPFSILQKHESASKKRISVCITGIDYNRFPRGSLWLIRLGDLFNTTNQVLHEAEL